MIWENRFKNYLIETSTLSEQTINQNLSRLRMFNAWSIANAQIAKGNTDRIKKYGHLSAISSSDIRSYFDALLTGGHPIGFRQHVKTAMVKYYDYLLQAGAIKEEPNLNIPIRKSSIDKAKTKNILTEQDVEMFRSNMSGRDRFLLECMICLGARAHEIAMLRACDFDIPNNIVRLRSTKTEDKSIYGGERLTPITPKLLEAFTEYVDDHSSEASLFNITTNRMGGIVKAVANSIDMSWVSPHAFRHYCITQFSSKTGDDGITPIFRMKELSMMFGVSPKVIAETYYHPNIEGTVTKALSSGLVI